MTGWFLFVRVSVAEIVEKMSVCKQSETVDYLTGGGGGGGGVKSAENSSRRSQRREPGRVGKIICGHRQDGNVAVGRTVGT